jgi:hypothetical protein
MACSALSKISANILAVSEGFVKSVGIPGGVSSVVSQPRRTTLPLQAQGALVLFSIQFGSSRKVAVASWLFKADAVAC